MFLTNEYSFEPFKQLASNEANHGGTGLGLAITRQLVKALDGTISVQSDFGRWCEFTVNLPCKFKTIFPLLDSSTTPQSSNRKILVTECTHPTGLVLSSEDDLFDSDDSYTSSTSCTVLSSMSFQHILDASKRKNEAPCKPSIQTETVDVPNAHFGRIKIGDGSTTTSESVPKLNQKDINTQAPEYLPKANQEKSISTSSTEPRSFEQLRVLVAEDNLINQKVLRKALTRVGVKNIETVDNGQKAVEASEKNIFDIIFMDMQMPIMDGLEATSIISKRVDRPKIVFLTAHALREFQEKAVEAGGDGFISKPFKLGMIRETLDGLLIKRDTDIYDE
jgi:CheY-like chemotaxis protein